MARFAAKLLLFAVLFLIYDKIFIGIRNRSAETEVDTRLENLINGEVKKDIIIVGSSRGSRGIIAGQIESGTGFSTFNLCYPGSNVIFHEFILRTLIKFNGPPKIVLLVVDDSIEFQSEPTVQFRRDLLYSQVKYPYVRQELIDLGFKDKFLSKFLTLHQLNKTNFDLRKKVFTPLDTVLKCGSMPISWQNKGIEWYYNKEEKEYKADNEMTDYIAAYKKIIKLCSLNNIKLVIILPPLFRVHGKSFETRIRQCSGKNAVIYRYNDENPIYKNKDYFYDKGHLIRNGAIVFTNELIVFLSDFTKRNNIVANKP